MTLHVNADDTELSGEWIGSEDRGQLALTRTSCSGQPDINRRLEPLYAQVQALIASLHADAALASSQAADAEAQGLLPPGSAEEVGSAIELAAALLEGVEGATRVQFFFGLDCALQEAQAQSLPATAFAELAPAVLDAQVKLQQVQMDQARAIGEIAADQALQRGCATAQ